MMSVLRPRNQECQNTYEAFWSIAAKLHVAIDAQIWSLCKVVQRGYKECLHLQSS